MTSIRKVKGALIDPAALPLTLIRQLAKATPTFCVSKPIDDLLRLTLMSKSLTLQQKTRVLDDLPTLSAFQCDELVRVFTDEHKEFSKLVNKEFEVIARLQAEAILDTMVIAKQRLGASNALIDAWTRRLLRQGALGGLMPWLRSLPTAWWDKHKVAGKVYSCLFPSDHPSHGEDQLTFAKAA